jgi:hypothetical protein
MLERLMKELKRRTKVVEIFRDIPSVTRLVGALLVEADDEWQASRPYFSKDSMRQLYNPDFNHVAEPTPLRLAPVLESRRHPRQAHRFCLGILGLGKRYTDARMEAAVAAGRAACCELSDSPGPQATRKKAIPASAANTM